MPIKNIRLQHTWAQKSHEADLTHAQPPRVTICLTPLILDRELPWADGHGGKHSLLMAPLGTSSVLSCMVPQLAELCDANIVVIASGNLSAEYDEQPGGVNSMFARVFLAEELTRFLADCEESDYLLVLDSRYWSVASKCLSCVVRHARGYRGATHGIAVGADWERTREQADRDQDGFVRRVSRLYTKMTWPETDVAPVVCSVVPARAVQGISFATLSGLRASLIDRGVFSQDIPVISEVEDLTQQADLLALNESVIRETVERPPGDGLSRRGPEVLVGSGTRIHPSARLVGPIIVQAGAVIGAGSTLIGPVLVGEGSKIGRKAIVAQSVLGRGISVVHGAMVSHEFVLGGDVSREGDRGSASRPQDVSFPLNGHCRAVGMHERSLPRDRRRLLHLAIKRIMDISLALLGMLILSPVFILAAFLIKVTSPGPVFFTHRREGKDGQEFPCLKFRTMASDAHRRQRDLYEQNEVDGPQFKIARDPRLTRIGPWLRRTNIDEIPQLLNVLIGHMSLVGPRPSPFRENQICVPWRRARLSVRPGITGLWQLCRGRGEEGDFHEWIYYDMAYVRAFSIWLDLKILFYTVLTKGGRKRVPLSRLVQTDILSNWNRRDSVTA